VAEGAAQSSPVPAAAREWHWCGDCAQMVLHRGNRIVILESQLLSQWFSSFVSMGIGNANVFQTWHRGWRCMKFGGAEAWYAAGATDSAF
jgi:hypothetical protein